MNLCSDSHDEVCYESRDCPVCLMREERDEIEDITAARDTKIDELEETIAHLRDEIYSLQEE